MKAKTYREPVEITGSVYQINIENRTFKMKTDDGLRVTAPYTEETKHRVFQVAQNPEEWLIKVSGMGEFAHDGALKRVVKSDHIIFAIPPREVDPNAPTIGERFDALTADIPEEVWAQIPTDLSERHNYYAYGVDLSE